MKTYHFEKVDITYFELCTSVDNTTAAWTADFVCL